MGFAAAMAMAFAPCAGADAGAGTEEPPPWKWDRKGNYYRPKARQNFLRVNRIRDIPRYPIVLVHGLFGYRNLKLGPFLIPYFLGVAEHLRREGMQVFLPETTPFASFEQRATELKQQIESTGWEKFHLIAHSAGGLDSRYMIAKLGMADRVASLTTVSTPHQGVWYADFALKWVFEKQKAWKLWDLFGLHREGIHGISVKGMRDFNAAIPNQPGVRYFSFVGAQSPFTTLPLLSTATVVNTIMEKAVLGRKPSTRERLMGMSILPAPLRKLLATDPRRAVTEMVGGNPGWVIPAKAGRNDGLVSLSSGRWGEFQADLDADHLDEMGWFTIFPVRRFYRNITRMLFDAGM